ncbi:MAG: EscS/YscS/HrcS family type III secretion system export apparatus protein [Deltaproteobacteria bacterium RIFCSPLOWO2_02_FULL_50_16]|nr:MAG: EscS/YscS/HrcS family type III secretion system export apparatus protein [Deltaproteobacteria bacterium RIFCSPHIGHO2_02_FULL_50_15]OGQ56468.1 MAG: EscS/YscS/HrcS family type III secretion system export apparatus protein [Deltaproteobacteria bacterium RIFCSPLOWO2_02_FULL_50_16]OGQ68928.1 MAG: EscS/YscS/HrcS family type III secretion system export apparatus protein [Deltaproteobacteria bacterium RIFCSPLOWO2_12_FULL_50_11]
MDTFYIAMGKQALFLVLILTAPPVLAAMLVGLTVSLFQATTQLQEMTLTFVPKLVTIILVLALVGPWSLMQVVAFANNVLTAFPQYVK